MKKIGLVGGISWVSTIDYYRYINELINEKLGGLNYAECIIYSVNFQEIHNNNNANDWDATFQLIADVCDRLKKAGAEAIVLGANTMHLLADKIERHVQLPLIHVAEATANVIQLQGHKKVGLLGTKFTMEQDFFKNKLENKSIETIIPNKEDISYIVKTLDEELHKGILRPETKKGYLAIINKLLEQGAEGIILGCTEIPLLIQPEDVEAPTFNTTEIHSRAAVDFALS